MKNLEKAIILALHPECKNYEEAVRLCGECILCGGFGYTQEYEGVGYPSGELVYGEKIKCKCPIDKIETLPISLPRVMQAISNNHNYSCYKKLRDKSFIKIIVEQVDVRFTWKLTENGKDLNLEDQTEETREALSKLFNV